MLDKSLAKLGFSEKEIKLYLAILPLGSVTASVVGAKVGFARTTAQYVCQQLAKRGVLNAVMKGNAIVYNANQPERMLGFFENERRQIEAKESELMKISGELKLLMNPCFELPKVSFYQGVSGVIEVISDVLNGTKVLYGAARLNEDMDLEVANFVANEYRLRRIKNRIRTYGIFNDNELSLAYRKSDLESNRVSLLLPEHEFPFKAGCHIYDGKVAFYSMRKSDLTGVIIENKNIYDTSLALFRASWNYARGLDINSLYKDIQL